MNLINGFETWANKISYKQNDDGTYKVYHYVDTTDKNGVKREAIFAIDGNLNSHGFFEGVNGTIEGKRLKEYCDYITNLPYKDCKSPEDFTMYNDTLFTMTIYDDTENATE